MNETTPYQSLSALEDSKKSNAEAREAYLKTLEDKKQAREREQTLRIAKQNADAARESALQKEVALARESQQIRHLYPKM